MGRFYNNRGKSINILTATNKGNNRRTAFSMRRPSNTTLKNATIYRGNSFLCGPSQANAWNNKASITAQQSCKHAFLTIGDRVFREVRVVELSCQSALGVSQFSVGDGHWNFVVQEELEVGLWTLNAWSEDFICAVVQWYLECDSRSSCVKICCQETDRGSFAGE
jgi:hypothetical protein